MGKRILVVDDERSILELMTEILTSAGYEVDTAESAQGALDLIRDNIYDAAILDFNLPDMDGVMLHRQIRQMDFELAGRTLFTSGLVQSRENLGYYSVQGGGFLSKPFEIDEVVQAVRALVEPPAEDDAATR